MWAPPDELVRQFDPPTNKTGHRQAVPKKNIKIDYRNCNPGAGVDGKMPTADRQPAPRHRKKSDRRQKQKARLSSLSAFFSREKRHPPPTPPLKRPDAEHASSPLPKRVRNAQEIRRRKGGYYRGTTDDITQKTKSPLQTRQHGYTCPIHYYPPPLLPDSCWPGVQQQGETTSPPARTHRPLFSVSPSPLSRTPLNYTHTQRSRSPSREALFAR